MAWLDGQGLEERTIGKLMRRQWERSRWPRVPHVNAHQKMTSAEEELSYQVGRMTRLGVIPVLANVRINNITMSAETEAMHGFSNMGFHH